MEEVKLGRSLGVLAGVMAGAPAVRCGGGGRLGSVGSLGGEKEGEGNERRKERKGKEIEKEREVMMGM